MTKLMIGSILAICLVAPAAFAQTVNAGTSTTHIFPHGVDGRFADGTSYQSLIWIDNFGTSTANCTLTPLGLSECSRSSGNSAPGDENSCLLLLARLC